jgi:type I restriction enzyme, S subunit
MIQADTLKPGWELVKFGDVVRLSKERAAKSEIEGIERYVGLEHIDPEDLRIRRWGLVAEGITFTSKFKPGQVLFGKRRAYQRKVAVADFEGVCSGDIYVLESANPEVLLPELLPFICQTERFFEYAVGTSAGSLSPRTNWTSLAKFEFALPSIEKQRRILKLLMAIEITLKSFYQVEQIGSQLLEATSKQIFGELLRNPSVSKFKLSKLLQCPISNGIFRKKEQFGMGIKLINVTDIYQSFRVPLDQLKQVPVTPDEHDRFSAKTYDVIFNRSSLVLSGIGHASLVPETDEQLVFECHLMRARPNPSILFGTFLARYALSCWGRQHFLSSAQTTTMTTIGQSDLNSLLVPCPSLNTQQEIANKLDEIEKTIQLQLQQRTHLSALKAQIVAQLGNHL